MWSIAWSIAWSVPRPQVRSPFVDEKRIPAELVAYLTNVMKASYPNPRRANREIVEAFANCFVALIGHYGAATSTLCWNHCPGHFPGISQAFLCPHIPARAVPALYSIYVQVTPMVGWLDGCMAGWLDG